ncbi:processive 1,2-diacylglycerol beta-glucosyltransferase [Paenibacillus phyllosphaerae]|uniref:Processive 1,2-diacylglycerol beta-glucosyltransferase n=1 Tax=Paenibacillus phyllosphaerae TaxID=274593 RepID=A0A7W5B2W7_9BACL|nr:glycosyltransferase [Paenibacillus phyllosphaerae]MBB3112671.1 processive 1,2-diacylglycerol beta-glucosyltransferase [Paenibacillus phyllosphaerae]
MDFRQVRKPKVLVLYASFGDGHWQAARALTASLREQGIEQILLVDLLAEAHPWLNTMTKSIYAKSFTLLPGLYGWIYNTTRHMQHDSLFANWLHSFGRAKLARLLQQEKPDAVFHTFPLLAMPALKRKIGLSIPTYTVVTDFDLHGRWVHPDIDRYYVPTADMRSELIAHGIAPARICVSGIPLRQGFGAVTVTPALRAQYGFAPGTPIVLIMAGAQGMMSDSAELCAYLLMQPNVQIAFVCGRSAQLEVELRERFSVHPEAARLKIFGYVEQVHELMALSACLVTKPGGVTLAEGLMCGLPLFTHRPVPGQERNNAEYLQRKGAAVMTHTAPELADEIMKLIRDPLRLKTRKQAVVLLQHRHAAKTIALDFLAGLHIMERAASTWHTSRL